MSDCIYCKYRLDEDDNTNQNCSKWMNRDDPNVPCKPDNKEFGDSPNSDSDNCMNVQCPAHCQYPYPKSVYNDEESNSEYYGNNQFPNNNELKDNNDLLTDYLNNATDESKLNQDILSYNNSNVPDLNLKCGGLINPEDDVTMNFPSLPSQFELRNAINTLADQDNIGINWGAIKNTDKLREMSNIEINEDENIVTINDYNIPLADNGIELEWWDSTYNEDQLKLPIPSNIRDFQSLESIHQTTGEILQYVFNDHNLENMVIEEVYDWLRKRTIDFEQSVEGSSQDDKKFTMADFFGISTDRATNVEFEGCMNRIMLTNHNDEEHIERIQNFTHLSELGDPNNRKDLLYVEAKIIKFITVNPNKITKCFDIIYVSDNICEKGLSSNAIEMLGKVLRLKTDDIENEKYKDNVRVVSNRLLKYLPDIIKKIIAIAEYYEDNNCNGELSGNTIMLKEIYDNLFVKNNQMSFDYPDLGVIEFFQDFQKNIFTKSVLLIFVAFLITQFISLFNVTYNINK